MSALSPARASSRLVSPVLVAGCVIILLGFGVRASFGVFQIPIAESFGWLRADFSLAIAVQNLAWGIGQPLFAMVAERWGDRRALTLGALCYAVGLALAAHATTPEGHQLLNILIGFGIAGLGFGVILAMVGRAASEKNRSLTLGIVTAAGSAGQVVGPPVAEALLGVTSWDGVFLIFAAIVLATLLFLPLVPRGAPTSAELEETFGQVLRKAVRDPSYTLIFLGFFSCGYQLAFITAHFPAFVTEVCGPIDPAGLLARVGIGDTAQLGAWAIALIGLTNIAGAIVAGKLGGMFKRKYLLSMIYVLRTIVAAAFIILPMTPMTVILFSLCMGALWLATVPLTAGLVGYIYGMRYMGTLYGIIFLSHQLGSFLGVWLGGALYDRYGSYDFVWWIGVGVGAFSALVHLPVRERPLESLTPAAVPA